MFLSLSSLTVPGISDKTEGTVAAGRQGLENDALAMAFAINRDKGWARSPVAGHWLPAAAGGR